MRYGFLESGGLFPCLRRWEAVPFLIKPRELADVRKPDLRGDSRNGQVGIGEQFFRLAEPQPQQILFGRDAVFAYKQPAKMVGREPSHCGKLGNGNVGHVIVIEIDLNIMERRSRGLCGSRIQPRKFA